MRELSTRQQTLLKTIEEWHLERGYGPSIRELGIAADISSTSVVDYNLNILEREGWIERDRKIARGIRLVKPLNGGEPKAACSICGKVGEVEAGSSGVMIVCPEHGVYSVYKTPTRGGGPINWFYRYIHFRCPQ